MTATLLPDDLSPGWPWIKIEPPGQVWLFGTDGTLHLVIDEDADVAWLYGGRRGDRNLTEIQITSEKQGIWRVEEEFVNATSGSSP